jgi:hypothetical protein
MPAGEMIGDVEFLKRSAGRLFRVTKIRKQYKFSLLKQW